MSKVFKLVSKHFEKYPWSVKKAVVCHTSAYSHKSTGSWVQIWLV